MLAPQPKALEHNAQVNKIRKPLADLCWVPLPKPRNTSTCHPLASVQSWKPPLSAGLPPAEPNTACFLDTTGWSTQTQGSYHPTPTRATNVPVSAVSPCNISAPGRPRFPTLGRCQHAQNDCGQQPSEVSGSQVGNFGASQERHHLMCGKFSSINRVLFDIWSYSKEG